MHTYNLGSLQEIAVRTLHNVHNIIFLWHDPIVAFLLTLLLIMTLFLHIHTYVSITSIYRVMYRGRFAVCILLVLRCFWVSFLSGWLSWESAANMMSPHREPSPVHYMTKSPVSAAYLRGRRCCLCQREFIFGQPSSHILVFEFCDTCMFCVILFLSLYSRS